MEYQTETEAEAGIFDYEDAPPKPKRGLKKSPDSPLSQISDEQRKIGFILIVVGVFLLISEVVAGLNFAWWTLFLIVPGSAMLLRAINSPRFSDEWRKGFPGLMMLTIGLIFLLGLSWWLVLIAIGLGFLGGWLGDNK